MDTAPDQENETVGERAARISKMPYQEFVRQQYKQSLTMAAIGGIIVLLAMVCSFVTFLCNSDVCRVFPWQHKTSSVVRQKVYPHSYEACVLAGYAVETTSPRRCKAGNITYEEQVAPQSLTEPVVFSNFAPGQLLVSNALIKGKALGSWFFEGSFPVRVLDDQGAVVTATTAHADGNWMSSDYVPFSLNIAFAPPKSTAGYVEFAKDNPSGLPGSEALVRVPVRFK
jgi:hypothetical protein